MEPRPNPGRRLKQKLRSGERAFGLWVTLDALAIVELAVQMRLDWVCIDAEHGCLDFKEISNFVAVTSRSSTAALVRVQLIDEGIIKRVLDIGAHGVIVPRVRTAEEVERAVQYAKYPPRGIRGIGAERATLWGKVLRRAATANQDTLVIPIIEHVDAGRNLDAILKVPDVDAFFFGPADFSASAGYPGEWEGPGVGAQILETKDRIRQAGFACGVMAGDVETGRSRIAQGFQMIAIGADAGLLIRAISGMMEGLGNPVDPEVWNA